MSHCNTFIKWKTKSYVITCKSELFDKFIRSKSSTENWKIMTTSAKKKNLWTEFSFDSSRSFPFYFWHLILFLLKFHCRSFTYNTQLTCQQSLISVVPLSKSFDSPYFWQTINDLIKKATLLLALFQTCEWFMDNDWKAQNLSCVASLLIISINHRYSENSWKFTINMVHFHFFSRTRHTWFVFFFWKHKNTNIRTSAKTA